MRIAGLELLVSATAIGTPELELRLEYVAELRAEGETLTLNGTTNEQLERGDVELLRDACEAFLEGMPLPR